MSEGFIVFQRILVLLAMITLGFFAEKKHWVTDSGYRQISGLVVNIFNPMLVVNGVLANTLTVDSRMVFENLRGVVLYFAVMILLGMVGTRFLFPADRERRQYQLMYVFSNVGFMGIPVLSGLFGTECVIYITFYILGFNLLLYTYGIAVARRDRSSLYAVSDEMVAGVDVADNRDSEGDRNWKGDRDRKGDKDSGGVKDRKKEKGSWRKIVNPGVAACIAAILIFVNQIRLPDAALTFFDYMGNATIPLSMIVIGISIGKIPFRILFSSARMYLFCAIKLLAAPLAAAFLFRGLFDSEMLFGIFVLMFSMPVGSIVTMIFNEYGRGETVCSQGIVLSTLLSLITIPVVAALVL